MWRKDHIGIKSVVSFLLTISHVYFKYNFFMHSERAASKNTLTQSLVCYKRPTQELGNCSGVTSDTCLKAVLTIWRLPAVAFGIPAVIFQDLLRLCLE